MKRATIVAVLLLVLSGTVALAQDTPPPPPASVPMQMYHIVLVENGPNWKPQSQKSGMDARMEVIETIKKGTTAGIIVSAGLVNDETDVEFILILNVETKTEAEAIVHSHHLIKTKFFKPVIYSYFAPKGLTLVRK